MASYKSKVLGILQHVAMEKALMKKHELIWDSQYISTGFTYDGMDFTSKVSRGVPVPIPKEQAESLGIPDLVFMLKEWAEVKHHVIRWLNQSKDIEECCLWMPAEALEYVNNAPAIPDELPQWVVEIKESEPYQSYMALINYNIIAE